MKKKTATKILCGLGIITNLLTASYGVNDLTLSPTARQAFSNGLTVVPGTAITSLQTLIKYMEENPGNEGVKTEINQKLGTIGSRYKIEELFAAFATNDGQYFKYNTQAAQQVRTEICLTSSGGSWPTPDFRSDRLWNNDISRQSEWNLEYSQWFCEIADVVLTIEGHFNRPDPALWLNQSIGGGGWASWRGAQSGLTGEERFELFRKDITLGGAGYYTYAHLVMFAPSSDKLTRCFFNLLTISAAPSYGNAGKIEVILRDLGISYSISAVTPTISGLLAFLSGESNLGTLSEEQTKLILFVKAVCQKLLETPTWNREKDLFRQMTALWDSICQPQEEEEEEEEEEKEGTPTLAQMQAPDLSTQPQQRVESLEKQLAEVLQISREALEKERAEFRMQASHMQQDLERLAREKDELALRAQQEKEALEKQLALEAQQAKEAQEKLDTESQLGAQKALQIQTLEQQIEEAEKQLKAQHDAFQKQLVEHQEKAQKALDEQARQAQETIRQREEALVQERQRIAELRRFITQLPAKKQYDKGTVTRLYEELLARLRLNK